MTRDSLPGASLLHCLTAQDPASGARRTWVCADGARPPLGAHPAPLAVTQPRVGFRAPSISHSLAITEVCAQQVWGWDSCARGLGTLSHHVGGVSPSSCRHRRGCSSSPPGSPALSTGQAGSGPRPGHLGPHLAPPGEWTPKAPTHSRGVLPSNSVRVPITLLF